MSSGRLEGRVAIVTGSARRIGSAIARCLADEGAAVVVNGRTSGALAEEVAADIRSRGGRAIACLADITDPAAARHLVERAVEAFGRLDILVNNAAVRRPVRFVDMTLEEWRTIMSVILDGAFICSHAAYPYLKESPCGRIINISGLSAQIGSFSRSHVVAAKAGLIGFTKALARECGPDGITVNCVSPGLIEDKDDPPADVAFRRHDLSPETIPLRRSGHPDEVGRAIVALCSDDMSYVSGQTIHINGGAFLW